MVLSLVDTGVWVDWLRDRDTKAVAWIEQQRAEPGKLAVTQPVIMEVLQGVNAAAVSRTERFFEGFVSLDIDPEVDLHEAANLYRAVRQSGHTVRSSVDTLIAAVALRRNAVLVHKDHDFDRIAAVAPNLRTEALHES